MRLSDACRRLAIVLFVVAGCTTPPAAGVLTLAPAGMRLGGTSTPHQDGTLTMAVGGSAASEVFVDAGPVTITVTAAASIADAPVLIELWFAGTRVGDQPVRSTQRTAIAFPVHAQRRGPVAIQLVTRGDSPAVAGTPATVEIEKVVITEP